VSSPQTTARRDRSPSSGLLSFHKCVICLDSPTDLVATPCGKSPSFPRSPVYLH
jgi:hypothetical protein